eukprot:TRINITY_DN2359_c0_g1_i1.p1 TRINITY_DN2359_c0_g1~~TRINITY_DN2359_c0_g1_i1.p1  ORF type:complete len:1978 (-),score=184.73 TRINITY_DN2359_c0_g1_i1:941-6763(-)
MSHTKIKYPQSNDEMGQTPTNTLIQSIKNRFIHMCYEFNKYRFYPWFFSALLLIISYCQIYAQLFDSSFIPRNSDEWGPFMFVATLTDLLRISPYVGGTPDSSQTLAFVYIMFSLIVLYICSFYYMHRSINIRKLYFILPIELACLYGECLIWIFIIPVCEVYVSIFFCNSDGTVQLLPAMKCWSTEHSIHTAFVTAGLVLHVCAALIVALYFNESRPYVATSGEDGLTRLDTNGEVYYCAYRILISLLGQWLIEKELNWVLLLAHFIYAVTLAYNYYRYVPYYNGTISAVYGGCIILHLWQIVNILLYNALGGDAEGSEDRKYRGVAMVISIGMLVIFPAAWRVRKQLIKQKVIEIHHAKIDSDEELDLYVQSLLGLYNTQQMSSSDELLLRGVVARHKAECLDLECPLQKPESEKLYHPATDAESGSDKTNVKDKIVVLALINSVLKERERRLGEQASACLHLIYANFLFKEMGNIHMAIVEVMKAQKASPSYQQEVSIYHLLRSIEEYLVKKYRNKGGEKSSNDRSDQRGMAQSTNESLDVTIVIKFENWLFQLIRTVEKCAGEHIEFWGHLESLLPDLNELNRIGISILQSTKEISAVWRKISKININHPKALNIYGYYLRDIKNDTELGQEYIERAVSINLHKSVAEDVNNEFEIMFAEDTAIIVINGSPEYLGKIMKTNAGVFKLFGYNPYEIYGNDVSILMPGLFAQQHQKFMQRYFETGRQYMIQNERMLFALHRNNYLFCVSIVIKPVASLSTAVPHYIGLLRQVQKEFDFIITDKYGKIDAISMGIYHTYNITANFIKENQVYIHLICPELADPVYYKEQRLKLKFDMIHGRHRVNFVIPRDFTTLAHLFSQTAKDPLELTSIVNQHGTEDDFLTHKLAEAPQFFNYTYKIYKGKYKGKEFDIAKKNVVKECFDYSKFDVKTHVACDVMDTSFAGNMLKIKVFKIYRAKMVKRKNSLEEYYGKEDNIYRTPQKGPPQTSRKPSHFEQQYRRVEVQVPKRSCTGEVNENENDSSQKRSQKQDSELAKPADWSPSMNRVSAPASSEIISIENFLHENHKDGTTKQSEEKKEKGEMSMCSEKKQLIKLHGTIGESASNSTPDPRVVSASGASEGISNTEEEKRLRMLRDMRRGGEEALIIKTIDTRQMEVAKQILLRKKTFVENEKAEKKQDVEGEQKQGEEPSLKKEPSYEAEKFNRKQAEDKNRLADEIGSVSTTNHHLMRVIHSLQSALNEMYSPPAIAQLKGLACGVLVTLAVLTIVCFIMARYVYFSLEQHLENVIDSRDRTSSIGNVAGFTRLLVLLTCDRPSPCLDQSYLNYNNITGKGIQYLFDDAPVNYTEWVLKNVGKYSDVLKRSQVSLSESEKEFTSDKGPFVNPPDIKVNQIPITNGVLYTNVLACANAIDALVIHALRVKAGFEKSKEEWIKTTHESVTFILDNALNSILSRLEGSLGALLDETQETAHKNQNTLLIFLFVASGALILTISVVMPVVVKIRKNKQELLCLFLEIPIKKAKGQLEKCHLFCRMIHGENEVERQEFDDDEKNNQDKKFNEETDLLLDDGKNSLTGNATEHPKKRRKFKPYSAEILSLIIETIVVIFVLEAFFLYNFLRAMWLTETVTHLMNEVGSIANRMTSNEIYYWIELELVSTNGTGRVMNQLVETYIDAYNAKILTDQEAFLQIHSSNSPYNNEEYKALFDVMIYSDVCGIVFDPSDEDEIKECQNYMDGVLKKGLNSANVAFWDSLKEIANDFRRSQPRDLILQDAMLKDSRITQNHWLLYRYFTKAYNKLQDGLKDSMQNLFKYEKMLLTIIFITYFALLLLIYIVFTKVFVENTKDSLWVTKSLLTILPPEIILQVGKIRHFVLSTSKSMIYGLKNDQMLYQYIFSTSYFLRTIHSLHLHVNVCRIQRIVIWMCLQGCGKEHLRILQHPPQFSL